MRLSGPRAGVIVSYLYTFGQIAVQLLFVPLLLGGIGQAEYGLYQLVGSVMAYIVSINGILSAGVGRYYCMYLAECDSERMENTLAISKRLYLILSIASFFVVLVLSVVIRFVYAESFSTGQLDEMSAMLIVLGLNCIVTMNNAVYIAAITAHERFVFLKLSQLIALIAQPAFVAVLMRFWGNALMVCAVILLTNALCALSQRFFCVRKLGIKATYHGWDKSLVGGLLKFGSAIIMVTIADQIFWKTDQLIIGYFYGADSVAIYAVGSQIFSAYMAVGTAVASVFMPKVSFLYHKERDLAGISTLFAKVGRISFIVCGQILGAFIIFGDAFILLWVGEGFHESYLIALIIMIPYTIDIVQNLGLTILQVEDKYYFRGVMYLLIAILNIVATIALVQCYGILGAAVSTAVATILGNGLLMNWYYAKRAKIDIKLFWSEVCKLLVPMTIVAALVYCCWHLLGWSPSWCSILLAGVLYCICQFALLWIAGFNDYERGLIASILKLPVA
jgi:O-antigen/teichoic acid export membrane protein